MSILGAWDVTIKTPIGSLALAYTFAQDGGAGIAGVATLKGESVPLQDISVTDSPQGQRVTWRQSVTKPMRLNLDFDIAVTGDRLEGHSRAGKLPRSTVTGARRV